MRMQYQMKNLCNVCNLSYSLFVLITFYQTFAPAQLLTAPNQTPSQTLSQLNASDLLQERCMVRTNPQISSFFITEQDSIPNAAGDLQVYLPLNIESLLR